MDKVKYVELYQHSPSSWWVSYAEETNGHRTARYDVSMNLSMVEAERSAMTRQQISGLPIYRRHNVGYPLYHRGAFAPLAASRAF